jgi:hypothetical protein
MEGEVKTTGRDYFAKAGAVTKSQPGGPTVVEAHATYHQAVARGLTLGGERASLLPRLCDA